MQFYLDIYFTYWYSMEVVKEQLYIQYFAWGLHVVLLAGAVCIDDILLGFQSVEELYPSPPLGVDRADSSHFSQLDCPGRRFCMDNSNFPLTQPGSSTITFCFGVFIVN